MPNEPETTATLKDVCNDYRETIETMGVEIKGLMCWDKFPEGADIGETKANIMLAYRHLEDARMRLGKVIQALDGGVSIYDKK